ncbi:MAG: histidinol dehydrogenase [bacterium]|jgi:histidinol dehydrogenase|nr:histidinol dehydrogenase [candidate division KSB1 bacterium]MDH7561526.1 histidinol dehydrogenase [bacterium]
MRIVHAEQLGESFYQRPWGLAQDVRPLLEEVRRHGDAAVRALTLRYDGVRLESFWVEKEEIQGAFARVPEGLVEAIRRCIERLRLFCERQLADYKDFDMEIETGLFVGQRVVPVERVGVYAPGGRFPLISSVYMGVVPARVAGVRQVVVCSPPTFQGSVHPALLVAADLAGADEVYRIGGVQAIAALAYGTESVRAVHKIVGPGNAFVTAAKREVYGQVGIDFVAGPSEVLIIADEQADAEVVAADLLAQAEHDPDASPLLVTTSARLAERVRAAVARQVASLATAPVARASLERNGLIVLARSSEEAIAVANRWAPEHLELQVRDVEPYLAGLRNFGSLFIGAGAAEALGDYSSGLNHVLPSNGAARYTGGLGVRDFLKVQTVLRVEGSPPARPLEDGVRLAQAEGLEAHARSLQARRR